MLSSTCTIHTHLSSVVLLSDYYLIILLVHLGHPGNGPDRLWSHCNSWGNTGSIYEDAGHTGAEQGIQLAGIWQPGTALNSPFILRDLNMIVNNRETVVMWLVQFIFNPWWLLPSYLLRLVQFQDGVASSVSPTTCSDIMQAYCTPSYYASPMLLDMSDGSAEVIAGFLIARGPYWWIGYGIQALYYCIQWEALTIASVTVDLYTITSKIVVALSCLNSHRHCYYFVCKLWGDCRCTCYHDTTVGWQGCNNVPALSPLLHMNVGLPINNCSQVAPNVFARNFTGIADIMMVNYGYLR